MIAANDKILMYTLHSHEIIDKLDAVGIVYKEIEDPVEWIKNLGEDIIEKHSEYIRFLLKHAYDKKTWIFYELSREDYHFLKLHTWFNCYNIVNG